jgi:acyl-CoA synthetase (AMP-forming)/AMP-acid ligase II
MFLPDELRDRAERFGDRSAVQVVGGGSMTFREWDGRSNALARGLVSSGVGKGDRVGLLLGNEAALEFCVTYFALHKAGAVAVPINPRYADREVEHILDNAEVETVVTAGDQLARVQDIRARVGRDATVLAPLGGARADAGVLDWDALAAGDPAPFQTPLRGDDLADIFYTSGTTGLPKGVASTHDNAMVLRIPALEGGGKLIHAMPLPTFTGVHGAQVSALRMAVTAIVLPRFDVDRFADLVCTERPNFWLTAPAQILLLLESGALEGRDTSSVFSVMFGGAPTPPEAVEQLGEVFPHALLLNGYGLTEGGGSICVLPPGEARNRPGSVGKPMEGVSLRIVGEAGDEVAVGQVGEVVLRVPAGERSYYRDPEATAQTWRDGWVHTGDLGRLDSEGFLYIVDRKKDVINRGGYNVYSVEVESALFEHPDVAEVAAIGIPHGILGEDVCAVVRLRAGARPLTLDDVRAFLADRLADYKLPRRIVLRERPLPRSAAHKVDKGALLGELTMSRP